MNTAISFSTLSNSSFPNGLGRSDLIQSTTAALTLTEKLNGLTCKAYFFAIPKEGGLHRKGGGIIFVEPITSANYKDFTKPETIKKTEFAYILIMDKKPFFICNNSIYEDFVNSQFTALAVVDQMGKKHLFSLFKTPRNNTGIELTGKELEDIRIVFRKAIYLLAFNTALSK